MMGLSRKHVDIQNNIVREIILLHVNMLGSYIIVSHSNTSIEVNCVQERYATNMRNR